MATSVHLSKRAQKNIIKTQSYYLNQRFSNRAVWRAEQGLGVWFPGPPRINSLMTDVNFTRLFNKQYRIG